MRKDTPKKSLEMSSQLVSKKEVSHYLRSDILAINQS